MKQLSANILFLLLLTTTSLSGNGLEVRNLSCDYQSAPIGIDNKSPRLGWKIYSGRERNIIQSSYHILVASSENLLNENDADMWNSGEILSDNSIQVKYEGKNLQSAKRYFWKVRVKDELGALSPFSDISFFEMALLEEDDWYAKWISAPSVADWPRFLEKRKTKAEKDNSPWEEGSPLFRTECSLKRKIESARMYVSGLGFYEAFLNGEKVGNHELDPAFTRYDKTILYSVYDVTSMLKKENAVGIVF